jgi:ABC-type sugar transport systems, permease components
MKKQNWWGVLLVSPFILGCGIFFVFPVIFSAYISFTKWDMFNAPKWVGIQNWLNNFKEPVFWTSFRNVIYFAVIFVPIQTFFALVTAYLLNQQLKGKTFYRVLYFLPVVTPWVAGAVVWKLLYNYDLGILNYVLKFLHIEPSYWFDSEKWWIAIGSIALMNVWKGMGQSMVMILAGMQNVSGEVLEAAYIDGATKRKIFQKIIIPFVSPMLFLVTILSCISAFTTFDVFVTMYNVFDIADSKNVVNLLIYRSAFLYNKMGYASATAWALFAVILAVTVLQKKFEKRWVHYEN